jgi:hypothetical protein
MRLLLRNGVHLRRGAAGREIAASPDGEGDASWEWDVRLVDGASEATGQGRAEESVSSVRTHHVELPDRTSHRSTALQIRYRPDDVEMSTESLTLTVDTVVARTEPELCLVVCSAGEFQEGPRVITRGDALILEGDDPLGVTLAPGRGRDETSITLIRFRRPDGDIVRWVP